MLTIATWILCGLLNVTETLRRLSASYERYQLDKLPTVLLVLGPGLTGFALRGWREARQEIARRKSAEAQLTAALADNRRRAQQYVALQEAERKTLARELRDALGQYLHVITLDAVQIRDDRRADAPPRTRGAGAIVEHCAHIHPALATLIRELRPAGLDERGLAAALEHCIRTWRSRLPAVAPHLSVSGDFAAQRAAGLDLIRMRERVTAQHGELTSRCCVCSCWARPCAASARSSACPKKDDRQSPVRHP